MKHIDATLQGRSATLMRDFAEKHDLHGIVEITSSKSSHVLIGTYEGRDGSWMARIQPAHLYDARFRAGTFSLSIDQLDALIDALSEVRDVLSDRPTNKVHVVKPATKKVAAVTQAPAPATASDPVLAAVEKLSRGLEAVVGRLEALESSLPQEQAAKPQKPQANTQEVKDAVEWQLWHGESPYSCPICGKEYKSRGRYLTHMAEHGIAVEG